MTNHWNGSLLEWAHVNMFSCGCSWSARQDVSFESKHDHNLMMYWDYEHFVCMCVHWLGHNSTHVHFHAWMLYRIILSSMSAFMWATICLCLWENVWNVTFRQSKCIGWVDFSPSNFLFLDFHALGLKRLLLSSSSRIICCIIIEYLGENFF